MAYKQHILLGRIIKVSGYEGAVAIRLQESFIRNIPDMEWLFLEIEGRKVPFLVSDKDYSGADILKIIFEGYKSVEKIREFTGCNVFLTEEAVNDNYRNDLQDMNGYCVLMQDDKALGTVTEVIISPGQLLLNILSTHNRNILVPFHEDFIVSIDKRKKILRIDIPEGLTEIN